MFLLIFKSKKADSSPDGQLHGKTTYITRIIKILYNVHDNKHSLLKVKILQKKTGSSPDVQPILIIMDLIDIINSFYITVYYILIHRKKSSIPLQGIYSLDCLLSLGKGINSS